jgi:hypothetical protein
MALASSAKPEYFPRKNLWRGFGVLMSRVFDGMNLETAIHQALQEIRPGHVLGVAGVFDPAIRGMMKLNRARSRIETDNVKFGACFLISSGMFGHDGSPLHVSGHPLLRPLDASNFTL